MRNQHNCNTRGSKEGMILKITRKTMDLINSICHKAANNWNELVKNIGL